MLRWLVHATKWADRQVPDTLPPLSPRGTRGCPLGQWLRPHLPPTQSPQRGGEPSAADRACHQSHRRTVALEAFRSQPWRGPLPLLPWDSSVRRALPASRSYRTVSPERKEATMWAGSVLVKATEVGIL